MKIVDSVEEFKGVRKELKGSVGFVPTMGALHRGHLELIKRAKIENDHTVVSIFVNPTQFLPGEDLDSYPRRKDADSKICEVAGVDVLFMPHVSQIYKKDEIKLKAPSYLGYILEGYRRPGHFDGVLRVVMKLFSLTKPDRVYFGKKDAQQLVIVQKMVRDLFLPVDVVAVDTVREEDGLALSSRNLYLSQDDRKKALLISKSLREASKLIASGELNCFKIKERMLETLSELDVEYVEIVDREFAPIERIKIQESIILVAAKVGKTRLIDNIWV